MKRDNSIAFRTAWGGGQAKQIRDDPDLESGAARPEELSCEVSEEKTARGRAGVKND